MQKNKTYPFELEPLPYSYEALEPSIDARTLTFHHDRHLQTYVDNLNKALEPYPAYHGWTLEELLLRLEGLPENLRPAIRNNAGGVYNHELYFACMGRQTQGPEGELKAGIEAAFGSLDNFKNELKAAALSQFGSGWAWLIADAEDGFHIVRTPNQDTPLRANVKPLLLVDVWEHAYYLQYQNRRAEYVDKWFEAVDWEQVEKNLAEKD